MIFGGSTNMGIGIAVTLRDNFTNKARGISTEMRKMHKDVRKVQQANLQAARSLSMGVAAGGAFMIRGLSRMVKTGAEFNYIMSSVKAVTQGTKEEMKGLHDLALDLAGNTVFTNKDIGSGMKYLGMAGFNTKDIKETIGAATSLSAATDTKLGGIKGGADILSNTLQQFGKGTDSASHFADVLTTATTRSNTDLTRFAQTVLYAGSTLNALEVPLEQTAALVAAVAGSGHAGSFAGTGLMNMFQQLTKAMGEFRTTKQSKVLEAWGLEPEDVMQMKDGVLHMKDVASVVNNIKGKFTKGMIGATQLDAMFGKRGARAMDALFKDPKIGMNLRELQDLLSGEGIKGTAARVAADKMANLQGSMLLMTSAWGTFSTVISEALEPILIPMIKALTWLIQKMSAFGRTAVGKVFIVLSVAIMVAVTAAGFLIFAFASIALAMSSTMVTAPMMGKSLALAWNQAAAAAARYAMIARGASYVSPGGGVAMKGMKGFQKAGSLGGAAAGAGGFLGKAARFLGPFGTFLLKVGPWLGRIAAGIAGFVTWPVVLAASIATLVVYVVGWKKSLGAMVNIMGQIVLGLYYVWDYITTLIKEMSFSEARKTANANWSKGQDRLADNLSQKYGYGQGASGRDNPVTVSTAGTQVIGLQQLLDKAINARPDMAKKRDASLQLQSQINIDGKKVAEATASYDAAKGEQEMIDLLTVP